MWVSQVQAGDRHFEKNCVRGASGLLPVCPSLASWTLLQLEILSFGLF